MILPLTVKIVRSSSTYRGIVLAIWIASFRSNWNFSDKSLTSFSAFAGEIFENFEA